MTKLISIFVLLLTPVLNNSVANESPSDWSLVTPTQCRFSGEFSQSKVLLGLDQPLASKGVFFYDCEVGIIWKTTSPSSETLVLNKVGESYSVKRLKIEAIQSQQNKFMSRIIMALVSADEDYLSKTFDHTRVDQNTVKLIPSNRHLQRAIESISLTENSVDHITFEMLDKNQQITTINSIVAAKYAEDSAADSKEICTEIDELSELECGLLSAAAN